MVSCPRKATDMPLNDCLSLFPVQALNRQELTAGWRMAIATLGEGEDRGYPRVDCDDDDWAPVAVPRLHGATSGNEAIWYRVRFPRPRHRQRTLLRFDGAFLVANVWLNGRLLGSHYGYFAPFSFDISSFLLEENVLAEWIHCESRLEQGDLARLALRTRLRNLDGRIMTGELAIRVGPDNFEGGAPLEMRRA